MGRIRTHTSEKVYEEHNRNGAWVKKRTQNETHRLRVLRDELDAEQEWTVTRKLMQGPVIKISIDALTAHEARIVADEVTYAQNWKRGKFSKDPHKSAPDTWALEYQAFELVRG